MSYDEHALTKGSDSKAVSYIQLRNKQGKTAFGVGVAENINTASLKAIVCGINRLIKGL
ncbi:MAG: alpha-isopropylmalate synthase regulatory domain-containing protein [Thermodesulfobacteriota bacterium]